MTRELILPVTGMSCGGCEQAVTRALGTLPGVSAVVASHKDARVRVTLDPALVSRDQVAQKIAKLGYAVGTEPAAP